MKTSPGLGRVQLAIILVVMILAVGFETKPSEAISWYNVTVRIVGVYTNVGTKVYAGGHLMGTVYGEGTLTFNTTYGAVISADDHTPDGYPYYGHPYYVYFTSWTGDYAGGALTGSIAMNAPRAVTANWKTQYLLTIDPKGGQADKTTQWVDSGVNVAVTALSPCNVFEKNSRSIFLEWQGAATGSSNPATLMMNAPKTLIATWNTQYYLIVETKRGAATGEGWYDADSIVEFSVSPEVPMEEPLGTLGGKYVFNGWTADSTANIPRATIMMDRAHIVKASWGSDYNMVVIFFGVVAAVGAASVVLVARRDMLRGLGRRVHAQLGGTSSLNSKPSQPKRARVRGELLIHRDLNLR